MDRPLLILSDAHLSKQYGYAVSKDLGTLLRRYPDSEVVLAGDIFDLSLDAPDVSRTESLDAALQPHEELIAALSQHLRRGRRLTFVPGNHDAGLHEPKLVSHLRRRLEAPDDRTLEVTPWFIRRGGVHIEHGHLYDPDCAPNHPLVDGNPRSEGLGTALMRRFVAPHDALFFAHANQTTPTSGISTAFRKWGRRAPVIIADYFKTATQLCLEAKNNKSSIRQERQAGDAEISSHAARSNTPHQVIEALLRLAPHPTHHSFRSTFLRLYFDRVIAIASLSTGISMLGAAGLGLFAGGALLTPLGSLSATGTLLSALGGGYLAGSTAIHKNRYGNLVIGQLEHAAHQVRAITESKLVIFGHTHVEVDQPGYVNLGSFGFGRPQRPFLLVDRDGNPERVYHTST